MSKFPIRYFTSKTINLFHLFFVVHNLFNVEKVNPYSRFIYAPFLNMKYMFLGLQLKTKVQTVVNLFSLSINNITYAGKAL